MTPHSVIRFAALAAVALMVVSVGTALAGDSHSQSTFGSNFFAASPNCPVRQFPTFESLVPVPGIVDPFEEDLIPIFCDVTVTRDGKGVKKAKGKFETQLIVRDNATGETETFDLGDEPFSTDKDGRATIDFDLPVEIFADGFESGDVSAWSYTRTTFTNKKRASIASQGCGTGSTATP